MTPPNNLREVRAFVGLVKYYRDVWYRRSYLVHPLTSLTSSKVKFKLNDMEQILFDNIKHTVFHDTLITYLVFNKCFDIHTDAINCQLGEVIIQYDKPIAFYSRKLIEMQT